MNLAPPTNGPRYALAIYDGVRHVGYAPRQGMHVVGESDGQDVDLFYSELGVRSQARARAVQFAPLTIAPYDLAERRSLDPITVPEGSPVPMKDEEYRGISSPEPRDVSRPDPVDGSGPASKATERVISDGSADRGCGEIGTGPSRRERAELRAMVRTLASAHFILVRMLDRLDPMSEG